MPLRIAWFISNHGWGHLNRSTVALQSLVDAGHRVLVVTAAEMSEAARQAVPDADQLSGALDRGYAFGTGGRGADPDRSRPLLHFATEVDETVLQGARAWRPDVVVADATPWASAVAGELGVPSVICSNFSWDDQYAALYERDREAAGAIQAIRQHVERFDLALELPLGPGIPSVRTRQPIPLVGRKPTEGVTPSTPPTVSWAFGRTPFDEQPADCLEALLKVCRQYGLEVAANTTVADAYPGVIRAVADAAYWPDVLASSRLVVTKTGYSTVAEALRGPTHVIAFGITGLPEERAMLAEIEARHYGRGIPLDESDPAERLADAASDLLRQPPRVPVTEDGTSVLERALVDLAGR